MVLSEMNILNAENKKRTMDESSPEKFVQQDTTAILLNASSSNENDIKKLKTENHQNYQENNNFGSNDSLEGLASVALSNSENIMPAESQTDDSSMKVEANNSISNLSEENGVSSVNESQRQSVEPSVVEDTPMALGVPEIVKEEQQQLKPSVTTLPAAHHDNGHIQHKNDNSHTDHNQSPVQDAHHQTQVPTTIQNQSMQTSNPHQHTEIQTNHAHNQNSQPSEAHGNTNLNQIQTNQQSSIQNQAPISDALLKQQFSWCKTTLRTLKKHGSAGPFLFPVDPIALGIPEYFNIIKEPMDLSTIEKKLNDKAYNTAEDFCSDVRLMLNNCFTYNAPDHQVHVMGRNLEKSFNAAVKRLPTSLDAAQSPAKQKNNLTDEDRRKSSRKNLEELKQCQNMYKELIKPAHAEFMFAFYQPVDPVALNIPTYFEIIKNPMDLSTMKSKLDNGDYNSPEEFEADFRLMVDNCLTFNRPGDAVYAMGQRALELFERKWNDFKPTPRQSFSISQPYVIPSSKPSSAGNKGKRAKYADDSDGSSSDEDDIQVSLLENQIMFLQSQLEALRQKKRKDRKKKGRRPSKSNADPALPRPPPIPKPPKVPRVKKPKKEMEIREITFDEKQELSNAIGELPEEKIAVVVQIIQDGLPHLKDAPQEEIEIDMDTLDNVTLNRLWNFVKGKKRKAKQGITAQDKDAAAQRILELGQELALLDGRVPTNKKVEVSQQLSSDGNQNGASMEGVQSNQTLDNASSEDSEDDSDDGVESDLEQMQGI